MSQTIHGDLSARIAVGTREMPWAASPSPTVWRKRLHLVGPAEAGQVTSIVRFDAGAQFPWHDHPEGEEILVLEGVFSDEQGDWPAGSYLLNPEGFRHAPYSRGGCVLFVKLRQYPGTSRRHVALSTGALAWQPVDGRATKPLYAQAGFTDSTRFERWEPTAAAARLRYPQGAELFVLHGSFSDEHGTYRQRTWLRLPPDSAHSLATAEGCELYVKEGGFAYLRSG
jgi:anti-sigma factor ChrR (cupin superfamily)